MCPSPELLPRLELTLATGWTELPKLTFQLPNGSTREQQPPPPPVLWEVLPSGTSVMEPEGDANLDCSIFLSMATCLPQVASPNWTAAPAELEFDVSSQQKQLWLSTKYPSSVCTLL